MDINEAICILENMKTVYIKSIGDALNAGILALKYKHFYRWRDARFDQPSDKREVLLHIERFIDEDDDAYPIYKIGTYNDGVWEYDKGWGFKDRVVDWRDFMKSIERFDKDE